MLKLSGHTGAVTAMAFSPDGRCLVTGGADGRVLLRRPPTSAEPVELPWPGASGTRPVSDLAFQPDGSRLVAARSIGLEDRPRCHALGYWDFPDVGDFHPARRTVGIQPTLAFQPNSARLIVVSVNHPKAWGSSGLERLSLPGLTVESSTWFIYIDWSSRALLVAGPRWFASSATDSDFVFSRAWETDEPGPFYHLGDARCVALAIHPSYEELFVLTKKSLAAVRADTREVRTRIDGFSGPKIGYALAVSPDGRSVAVGGRSGGVRLYDTATLALRAEFKWPIGNVTALAFSPDGLLCAAAGKNGSAVVWDLE